MEQYVNTIFWIVMVAILYLMVALPQRKAKQEIAKMQESIKEGETITTHSGIVGKVVKIDGDILTIATGPESIEIDVQKWSVISKA